jgi:hypothetical protein
MPMAPRALWHLRDLPCHKGHGTRLVLEEAMNYRMSVDELLNLPVSVDLVTAGRAFGLGRTISYELAQAGKFPCTVRKLGERYRVSRSEILGALGVDPADLGGETQTSTPAGNGSHYRDDTNTATDIKIKRGAIITIELPGLTAIRIDATPPSDASPEGIPPMTPRAAEPSALNALTSQEGNSLWEHTYSAVRQTARPRLQQSRPRRCLPPGRCG